MARQRAFRVAVEVFDEDSGFWWTSACFDTLQEARDYREKIKGRPTITRITKFLDLGDEDLPHALHRFVVNHYADLNRIALGTTGNNIWDILIELLEGGLYDWSHDCKPACPRCGSVIEVRTLDENPHSSEGSYQNHCDNCDLEWGDGEVIE